MSKMPEKILLVYPPIPAHTYWSFSHALRLIRKECAMPPLGLLTIAGLMPSGTRLQLVDMNFQPLEDEAIDWADMVLVSAMLIQQEGLQHIAARCRQRNTPVVAGGPYPSTAPEEMTGVDHILCGEAETGKHQNLNGDLAHAVRRLQAAGLEVMGGFIVGFDSDGPDIFEHQFAFIQRNAIPQAMVGLLTALPGTRLFQRLQEEGRLRASATGNNTHTFGTNFCPRMGTVQLTSGYRRLLKELYGGNLENYFQRCNHLFDRLGRRRLGDRVVGGEEILILLRALLRQPFTPYGWQYLKFLGRNLVRHAGQFTQAVKYGVVGHHFHRITRDLLKVDRAVALLDRITEYLQEQLPPGSASPGEKEYAQTVVKAWRWSQTALAKAYRHIERLPGEFRRDLLDQYDRVADQVWNLFRPFAGDLYRFGVRRR